MPGAATDALPREGKKNAAEVRQFIL